MPPKDAERTRSGLASLVLVAPGTGTERPGRGANLRAHYIAWTASDLTMFDNSYDRGAPLSSPRRTSSRPAARFLTVDTEKSGSTR